jgi:hypothetical protein
MYPPEAFLNREIPPSEESESSGETSENQFNLVLNAVEEITVTVGGQLAAQVTDP